MLKRQQEFDDWVRNHCGAGERLWHDELATSPQWYLHHPQHRSLETFYLQYSKWERWVFDLDAKVRSTLERPEAWLAWIARRLDLARPLRFRLISDVPGQEISIDLGLTEVYSAPGPEADRLAKLMHVLIESPEWDRVRQHHLNVVRELRRMVAEHVSTLWIAGEPGDLGLEAACDRMHTLAYVDVATVKAHLVSGEQHFKRRQWKPAATMMRNALEKVIVDAFQHVQANVPNVAAAHTVRAKAEGLGQHMVGRETGTFAYGVYAFLSHVGAHPAVVHDDEGERAWHAARAAISQFAARLT